MTKSRNLHTHTHTRMQSDGIKWTYGFVRFGTHWMNSSVIRWQCTFLCTMHIHLNFAKLQLNRKNQSNKTNNNNNCNGQTLDCFWVVSFGYHTKSCNSAPIAVLYSTTLHAALLKSVHRKGFSFYQSQTIQCDYIVYCGYHSMISVLIRSLAFFSSCFRTETHFFWMHFILPTDSSIHIDKYASILCMHWMALLTSFFLLQILLLTIQIRSLAHWEKKWKIKRIEWENSVHIWNKYTKKVQIHW